MSIADVTENNILKLIFNATAWANVAQDSGSSPITAIAMALHTGDPGESGTQTTQETTYGGYTRPTVPRSSSGWSVSTAGSTTLVNNLDYNSSTGPSTTITHFSAGKTGGGATEIFWLGALSTTIPIGAAGVIPRLNAGSAITLD